MKALLVAGVLAWVGLGACVLLLAGADLGPGYLVAEVLVVTVAFLGARRPRGTSRTDAPLTALQAAHWRSGLAVLCVAVVAVGLVTTSASPRPLSTFVGLGTALAAFAVAAAGLRTRAGSSSRPGRRSRRSRT